MSIFGEILSKIMGHPSAGSTSSLHPETPAPAQSLTTSAVAEAPTLPASQPTSAPVAPTPAAPVDIEAVLSDMAAKVGGGGNWRTSIVDLLKLLNLDSSLPARSELGKELGVYAGADGSAEENTALHRAVMQKIEENGGTVPASLKG